MSVKEAGHYRALFGDVSVSGTLAAADGDTTLIAAKTSHTIYVQRIMGWVFTDAAQNVSFESGTTAVQIGDVATSPGDSTRWDFDYGAKGYALPEGESLVANVSAAGIGLNYTIEAYQKLTALTSD